MASGIALINRMIAEIKKKKVEIEETFENSSIDIGQVVKEKRGESFQFELKKNKLKEIRMACIMDKFTFESYNPECLLFQLTPSDWQKEMEAFNPDLLFVESAWQGKNNLWYRKIANNSEEFYLLTDYCKRQGIPIIFWNKEDPIYTDTFMPAAKCADYVFTTDIDCIKKYKKCLKHERVYLLHFAAQPKVHNPIEKYERKDKFCFAGAYYHRYPKRTAVFDKFAKIFLEMKGLDIYDRNYQNSRPEHAFPSEYEPYILGKLESNEIDVAYKGYIYGINMNSVDQSQTMFARRVFEMMASNTITIGNYSRGVKNLFGDLTICTNDSEELRNRLRAICENERNYRKYRLAGLRKVLSEHLYEDRLSYIIDKVFGLELKKEMPFINLILRDNGNTAYGIETFHKLKYKNKKLYIIGDGEELGHKNIVVISKEDANNVIINEFFADGMIGVLSTDNYYGENYLMDFALAARYSNVKAYGKACYYSYKDNDYVMCGQENTYKYVDRLCVDRGIFGSGIESLHGVTLEEFARMKYVSDEQMLSIDEFNFCENYAGDACPLVDELYVADQGIHMSSLEKQAESIRVSSIDDIGRKVSYDEILAWAGDVWNNGITYERLNNGISLNSKMKEDDTRYIYLDQFFSIEEYVQESKLNLFFGGKGSLNCMGVCTFANQDKKDISSVIPRFNSVYQAEIPKDAKFFRLGIRLHGYGNYIIQDIEIGVDGNPNGMNCFLSKSADLILTNVYPSENSLYRNMFVHKRVKAYKEDGLVCDVMEFRPDFGDRYREFEGINIISGYEEELHNILSQDEIKTVCVHFLNAEMWKVLKAYRDKVRIIIWIHGAEIQPWWRRKCNYKNLQEEKNAKLDSKVKENLWNEVFTDRSSSNIHFVFVSQAFADSVGEDYKIELEANEYSIIHNYIDTEEFGYQPKDTEQRKKILSIRPYASMVYANDLSVKCILELSQKPFFKELEFGIYGDGIFFEETLEPLKKFSNVKIHKAFLRHDEIARLHKEYGVCLIPTRSDTQGVSRDEAMSSGLVAITNGIPAILEFTDDECAIVVPPEDYKEMAKGIEKLYNEPAYFLKLSANARARVENQTSRQYTISKEVLLIKDNVDE